MTDTARRTSGDVTAEVTSWLEQNWDPDLTAGEWWELLGMSGWAVPTWPEEWYGKGLSREEGVRVSQAIADFGALGPWPLGAGDRVSLGHPGVRPGPFRRPSPAAVEAGASSAGTSPKPRRSSAAANGAGHNPSRAAGHYVEH